MRKLIPEGYKWMSYKMYTKYHKIGLGTIKNPTWVYYRRVEFYNNNWWKEFFNNLKTSGETK